MKRGGIVAKNDQPKNPPEAGLLIDAGECYPLAMHSLTYARFFDRWSPCAEASFLQTFCLASHSGLCVALPASAGVANATATAAVVMTAMYFMKSPEV